MHVAFENYSWQWCALYVPVPRVRGDMIFREMKVNNAGMEEGKRERDGTREGIC